MQGIATIMVVFFWAAFIAFNVLAYGVLGLGIWQFLKRYGITSKLTTVAVLLAIIFVPHPVANMLLDQHINAALAAAKPPQPVQKPHIVAILDNDYRRTVNTNLGKKVEDRPPAACAEICLRLLYDAKVDAVIVGSSPEGSDDPKKATNLSRYELKQVPRCMMTLDALADPRLHSQKFAPTSIQQDIYYRASWAEAAGLCPVRSDAVITDADIVLQKKQTANYDLGIGDTGITNLNTFALFQRSGKRFVELARAMRGEAVYTAEPMLIYFPVIDRDWDRDRYFRTPGSLEDFPKIVFGRMLSLD